MIEIIMTMKVIKYYSTPLSYLYLLNLVVDVSNYLIKKQILNIIFLLNTKYVQEWSIE